MNERQDAKTPSEALPSLASWRPGVHDLSIIAVLFVITIALYARTARFDFINFDDDGYVWDNAHVQHGLTWENVRWTFTTRSMANWHPLTWLSYLLDASLFKSRPGPMHLENVVIHAINGGLLFIVLLKMTGARWPSAWVAGMFALHPLHVESVAWISERKDVLSTLFMFLSLLAYVRYVRQRTIAAYALVLVAFILGLLAKPMIVTLPCVMLLLDFWPLNRLSDMSRAGKLIVEKLPLLAVGLASCAMTVGAQSHGTSIAPLAQMSLGIRIANAIVAYATYLRMTVAPYGLALFYPHPGTLPGGTVSSMAIVVSGAVLAAITLLAVVFLRRMPWILVGWLWYLGTLVPVIGIVQVGKQAYADRYTYVPLIGIFIAIAWTIDHYLSRTTARTRLRLSPIPIATLLAVAIVSWKQIGYWNNAQSIWTHAIAVVPNNYLAHSNLGEWYDRHHDTAKAANEYQKALEIKPNDPIALYCLAAQAWNAHRDDEAERLFRASLAADPYSAPTYHHLAMCVAAKGQLDEAIDLWHKALELEPDYAEARSKLDLAIRYQQQIRGSNRPL